MSIKARRGHLLVALMVVVSALVFLVGPLTNKALAQTEPPPNLLGELLSATSTNFPPRGHKSVASISSTAPATTPMVQARSTSPRRGPRGVPIQEPLRKLVRSRWARGPTLSLQTPS
jgi:hypothetical protein